jgi:putative ABC transport system permease protein
VTAVTPVYAALRNLVVAEGAFLSDTEESGRSAVAVIGPTTADNLFGQHTNVVGMSIRISGQPFRVIGVLESKGGGGFGSQDDQILIPLSTGQSRLFHRAASANVDQILVQASSSSSVTAVSAEVTQILTARHRLGAKPADFTLLTQQDILSSASSITQIFTIFLGGIGGISLLVGGIGIMNIMLVSVTERTREIGLRKALGARRIDILAQFLVESLVLSLIGGAIGVGAAWGITALIGKLAASSGTAINPIINLNTVLLATLFSAAIGLFFGLYPANRASGLEPVEALRYE